MTLTVTPFTKTWTLSATMMALIPMTGAENWSAADTLATTPTSARLMTTTIGIDANRTIRTTG